MDDDDPTVVAVPGDSTQTHSEVRPSSRIRVALPGSRTTPTPNPASETAPRANRLADRAPPPLTMARAAPSKQPGLGLGVCIALLSAGALYLFFRWPAVEPLLAQFVTATETIAQPAQPAIPARTQEAASPPTAPNKPVLLSGRDPVYTERARQARVEGTMQARCTITEAGTVTDCKFLKTLPHMEQSVLDALYSRRYAPVIWGGKPSALSYVFNIRVALPQ
jgi:TonB family protein